MTTTQTERAFTDAVLELAKLYNWRTAHFRPGLNRRGQWSTPVAGDGAGFPDLVLVRDTVMFAELKVGRNKLSPAQQAWKEVLEAAGAEYHLWTPDSWDAIEARLRGYRRPNRILWNHRDDGTRRGEIDEVVFRNVHVHIEQMSEQCWWIGIYSADFERTWMGNIHTLNPNSRAKLTFTEQENDGFEWDRDDCHGEYGEGGQG